MRSLVTQSCTNKRYSAKQLHPQVTWVTMKTEQLKPTRQWKSQSRLKWAKTFRHQWTTKVVLPLFIYLRVSKYKLALMDTSLSRFPIRLPSKNRSVHLHLDLVAIKSNSTGLRLNRISIQSVPHRMSFSNLMPSKPIVIKEVVR